MRDISVKIKVVFLLGMHRSGTSLTAELINSMGFSVPGSPLDVIDEVNAHGFWESQEVVEINERILAAAELKWFHVCPVGHVFSSISDSAYRNFSEEIAAFVDNESSRLGDLVIKDPRLCLLLPLWLSAVGNDKYDVRVVFVNRHPAAVASSLQARDGFSLFSGHLLWLYYLCSVFSVELVGGFLYLNYEELISNHSNTSKLVDFLGAKEISRECWSRIVDPSLQRNFDFNFPKDGFIYNLAKKTLSLFVHGSTIKNVDFLKDSSGKFEKFLFESDDFVYALNESNNHLSNARSDLVYIGNLHSQALKTIRDKEFDIFENSAYIDSCHARISELDIALIGFDSLRQHLDQTSYQLALREEDVVRNTAYIAECEGRIFDLEFSMSEFIALRCRLADVELVLRQKELDADHNYSYINKLSLRIDELTDSMTEFESLRTRLAEVEQVLGEKEGELSLNADYMGRLESRIVELDDLFAQQRSNYLSALSTINQFENKLSSRNEEFFAIIDELSALREKVDSLLSWRVVKIIDRYISRRVNSSD